MLGRVTKGRKRAVISAVAAVVLGAGAALAWFSTTGSGTGSAQTDKLTNTLSITQIGAGYSSLIPSNDTPDPYTQDQCFECAQISELGDNVTLANPGWQQLTSVTIAMRNWGGSITGLPVTFSIPSAPLSDTQDFNFPAAVTPGTNPSVTNITFDFSTQNAWVPPSFVYGIQFDPTFESNSAAGLNVALSSSYNNITVGSETDVGTLQVDTAAGSGIDGDFPSCTTPGVGFAQVTTNCGPASLTNPGAYGTSGQVQAGNADVPAVQINVVGGEITGLYPGAPAQPVNFAITNPNSASVHVNQVTTSITGLNANAGCLQSWYTLGYPTVTVNGTVPHGTTIYPATGTSISMTNVNSDQSSCEGAIVNLGFTSN